MKQAAKVCLGLWVVALLSAMVVQWQVSCAPVEAPGSYLDAAAVALQSASSESMTSMSMGSEEPVQPEECELICSLTAIIVAVGLWAIPMYGDERAKLAAFSLCPATSSAWGFRG